jgi:superfamily II DNA helicase RecQ
MVINRSVPDVQNPTAVAASAQKPDLFKQFVGWVCDQQSCRRTRLLKYLGDDFNSVLCNRGCDVRCALGAEVEAQARETSVFIDAVSPFAAKIVTRIKQ